MGVLEAAPSILLFGSGSIGSVYLYQLLQAGCDVTAVCRSNFDHVKEHGFHMNSLRYGNVKYRPTNVIQNVADYGSKPLDYILVCAKSFPRSKPSLADMLRPALQNRPETAIVLAQNGIHIEEELAEAYPENAIVSGVVYLPAVQTAPGIIEYAEMLNLLELGTYPADAPPSSKAKAKEFADLMIRGGGGAEVHDDIQIARWSKLMMNAAWNPICALSLCSDGSFLLSSESADDFVWSVMLEVIKLADALGIPGVNEEVAESKIGIARKRAENGTGRETSMLQDIRQGRPFEVEAILGNTVRLAKKHSVDAPRLETLYALMKGRLAAQSAENKT